jgi:hypothetical protein
MEDLTKLLGGPLRGRMSRHAKLENASLVVRQQQKRVQDLEPYRGQVKKSTDTKLRR